LRADGSTGSTITATVPWPKPSAILSTLAEKN